MFLRSGACGRGIHPASSGKWFGYSTGHFLIWPNTNLQQEGVFFRINTHRSPVQMQRNHPNVIGT
jgi:hypothetical protein